MGSAPPSLRMSMHGFELAALLKSDPRTKAAAIVILTSGSTPGDAALPRTEQVEAYVTKPVRRSELLSTILGACNAASRSSSDKTPAS